MSSLAVIGTTRHAVAAPVTAAQELQQFNAIVFGNFTSNSDVEGRLAVGGNLSGGATFYNQPRDAASGYAAVNVAGSSTGSGPYNVNNGGSVVIGGSNASRFNLNGGGSLTVGTPDFSVADFSSPLTALAAQVASIAANSVVDERDPNNVSFNAAPNAQGIAVFSLSTTEMASFRNINFNFGNASTVYVNVTGGSLVDTANFNAGRFTDEHVLWNFVDAASLSFGFWHGAVLAPNATVTNTTPIEGTLVADAFDGRGELHDYPFLGQLPAPADVPEPASAALLGLGLAGFGYLRCRRASPSHA